MCPHTSYKQIILTGRNFGRERMNSRRVWWGSGFLWSSPTSYEFKDVHLDKERTSNKKDFQVIKSRNILKWTKTDWAQTWTFRSVYRLHWMSRRSWLNGGVSAGSGHLVKVTLFANGCNSTPLLNSSTRSFHVDTCSIETRNMTLWPFYHESWLEMSSAAFPNVLL